MPSAQLVFGVLFSTAVAVSLAVLDVLGVPWSGEALGALICVSAFAFLWLNERRDARMGLLLQKALSKAVAATSEAQKLAALEGEVVLLVGALTSSEELTLPRWGLVAPPGSAGLAVRVESYQELQRCSWRNALCQRGQWEEANTDARSLKIVSSDVRMCALRVDSLQLELLEDSAWQLLSPPAVSERLDAILRGAGDPMLASMAGALGIRETLPFPDEQPLIDTSGSVLYYPRGGGTSARPRFGDIRVTLLHLPGDAPNSFTAVGVKRGDWLESFRYRQPPPEGLVLGRASSEDFNIHEEPGYHVAPQDEPGAKVKATSLQRAQEVAISESSQLPQWLPVALRTLLVAFLASLEGWRHVLHYTVPESLDCLAPGFHTRCSFFARAYANEFWLCWRLRGLGCCLMAAGLQVALWQWEVKLAPFAGALWLVVLMGSAGFATLAVASASLFYRPVYAVLHLVCAVAIFCKIFGAISFFLASSCVLGSMLAVLALFAVHFVIPC